MGADKLNFNSCAGYPNNCITPVDWTAVGELGLTHGIMHCSLHGYPGLPATNDLPAGFSLYVLPLQMIEDTADLPSSVPCYHRNPEALGSFSSGLAYEYHPEFDQHFAVTDLDGNDCVGGEATAPGQFQYPGDEDPQDRYSWCVREGIHNRGIAISNPLRMWQEFSEGWSEVTHCSIRLRADVAGLPDTTVVFSYEYYEYDDMLLEWIQTDRVDFKAVQLDGHGTTFFELDIPVDLIGNPEIATQIWWSGMGDLYFDRCLYFNDCAANVLSGASDNDMALIVDRMEAVPNSGNIEGFNVADEIGYGSYHAASYVENRIRAVEGYETQYWIWPDHIDPANPRYLRYALERTSAPYYNLNQHTHCGWCVTEDPPNTSEFQTNIQDGFIARMRLTQDANRDHAYGKNFHSTIGSYSLDIEGEPILRNRFPNPHEVLLDVNLSLCYGAKGIWYYLFRGGQTGIELYEGILDENGAITNQAVFDEITRINGRLTGPSGTLLSTLDWQEGLSRHLSGASLDTFNLTLGGSVTNARSTNPSVPLLDLIAAT